MYTLVVERKYDSKIRFFGLCESCYWTASILMDVGCYECPLCKSEEIALIPISPNERYDYNWNSKQGLEIRFSNVDRA